MKPSFAARLSVLSLFILTGVPTRLAETAERPNIILMMADDLGWGDVGFNGGSQIRTPHLDAMAAAGLKFNRFYAAAPVCSPTRGSCLTGRHPSRYGIPFANTGHMKPQEWTIAEVVKSHGYQTGHFGKWHLGTLTTTIADSNRGGPKNSQHFSPPQNNGFDVCFSTEAKVPTYDPMYKPSKNAGNAWDSIGDLTTAEPYGTRYWDQNGRVVERNLNGDDSKLIMDRALNFIQSCAEQDQPFFVVIWFHAPHLPVVSGPEHRNLYPQSTGVRERNYFGCVTALDDQVGRLRKELRTLDSAENTLIAFCSDNGPEGQSHDPGSAGLFRGRKRSLYEGGIRVPALVEWPARIAPGAETDFPAVTSDYMPTILELLEYQLPDDRPFDGESLAPIFAGKNIEHRSPIAFASREQLALSGLRFKLYRKNKGAAWELYDLIADPGEKQNLADRKPEQIKTMRDDLQQWLSSCQQSASGSDYQLSN